MIIIGHRGAKGLAPENTIAGIKAGIKAGADWIEFDVRATSDGHAVVIHDATTARVSSKKLIVANAPLTTLREALVNGEKIPTIQEAFEAVGTAAKINVEIKSFSSRQTVIDAIKRVGFDNVVVSSFSKGILTKIHDTEPRVKLALLQAFNPFAFRNTKGLFAVGFHHLFAPRSAIALAKKNGLFTYAFTVDDPERAKALVSRGIDGIVTNFPDVLRSATSKK